jgi:hypothetical protein
MIISHNHKFLTIAIPKTGSKSIRESLDATDSNYIDVRPVADDINSPYYQHVNADRLKCEFDEKGWNWDEYFKFTFVRNPYSLVVSMYSYMHTIIKQWRNGEGKFANKEFTFAEAVKRQVELYKNFIEKYPTFRDHVLHHTTKKRIKSQLEYICDKNGNNLLDFVGRHENLQEDYDIVCDKIGIPKQKLLHKNKTEHKHYTEYYDDETKQIVAEKYAKDIEYFGYKFGE